MNTMRLKKLLILCLAANLIAVFGAGCVVNHMGGIKWLMNKIHSPARPDGNLLRKSVFAALPVTSNDIVLLGDSILANGEWSELLGGVQYKNRAISGDTTQMILDRLPPIINGHPKAIVLLIGINDLQEGLPVHGIEERYTKILDQIKLGSPETKIVTLPLMPVNESVYQSVIPLVCPTAIMPKKTEVNQLNQFLGVSSPPIEAQYTVDGLHLNGRGLINLAKTIKGKLNIQGIK